MAITITRYHDISCGHRVCGHESKCAHLHGHNYRFTFHATAEKLDALGRIVDFSVLKEKLCLWLEDNIDHRFLIWENDPWCESLRNIDPTVVVVPFNPTAENIAEWFATVIAPKELEGTGVTLVGCDVEETRKCCAHWRGFDVR